MQRVRPSALAVPRCVRPDEVACRTDVLWLQSAFGHQDRCREDSGRYVEHKSALALDREDHRSPRERGRCDSLFDRDAVDGDPDARGTPGCAVGAPDQPRDKDGGKQGGPEQYRRRCQHKREGERPSHGVVPPADRQQYPDRPECDEEQKERTGYAGQSDERDDVSPFGVLLSGDRLPGDRTVGGHRGSLARGGPKGGAC